MESRLGRAERDPGDPRHFGQRVFEEVVEDDDRPPVGVEGVERPLEQIPIDQLAAEVGRGGRVKGRELDLDHAPLAAAHQVEAGVNEDLMEPGVECDHVAQRGQVAPAANEGVLDRIPREVVVPDDQAGRRVQPRDGRAGQRREGVMIAPLRSLDESLAGPLAPSAWSARPWQPCSNARAPPIANRPGPRFDVSSANWPDRHSSNVARQLYARVGPALCTRSCRVAHSCVAVVGGVVVRSRPGTGPIRWWSIGQGGRRVACVDRTTRSFGVPDGVHVVGLFGGAIGLAALGLASMLGATNAGSTAVLVVAAVAALAVVLGCGASCSCGACVPRLPASSERSARRTRRRRASRSSSSMSPPRSTSTWQDPDVSDGGRLAYMSPQITGILGYGPEELVDDPELWPSRIHPDDREAAIAAYDAHWQTGEPLRAEYRMLARDGSEVWVRDEAFAMTDDTRSGRRVSQGLLVDTTDRKRLESRLIHDALHDPLTGLANRVLLRDHLERALARQGREPGRVALLFVDLDDFKRVNDTFGHAAGDEILCRVAERLARAVREGDVVGPPERRRVRDPAGQRRRGRRGVRGRRADPRRAAPPDPARRAVDRGRRLDRHRRRDRHGPGTEVGAAAKDLLVRADAAMYAAKGLGKGTFAFFDPRMPVRTWTELEAAG